MKFEIKDGFLASIKNWEVKKKSLVGKKSAFIEVHIPVGCILRIEKREEIGKDVYVEIQFTNNEKSLAKLSQKDAARLYELQFSYKKANFKLVEKRTYGAVISAAVILFMIFSAMHQDEKAGAVPLKDVQATLGVTSQDFSTSSELYLLRAPFHRPFQYVGMTIADAAKLTGSKPNSVGNIVVDSDRAHMLLETEGNFISYVDIELKKTAPCSPSRAFDSEEILSALSINPAELDFVREKTHFHTYYDHKRKLKVGVSCLGDGEPISVGFSSKYYGM